MFTFALIACFIGTPELAIVYVPVIMPLMLSLGYDGVTAAAISGVGWNRWVKFILPLFLLSMTAGAILLVVANLIGWS
ncbi:hypothetical protein ABEP17_11460 [Priestia flexa]|uniref:hypothetical protein n=1 Tax=Bacillaceae TaxID=186817 RepID=UPI000AB44E00|nr:MULTISPECIES: hypothetical protein [Bacillaceae]